MVDITHKISTLRKAIATASLIVSDLKTIEAIQQKKVAKGDVFEFSRAAGLLAVKKTSDVIPDCHPLPIEFTAITFEISDLTILIKVEVHTIYKTGVEVEAMHGAVIVALTMYDMLKPMDKGITIGNIGLLEKQGGKSSFNYGKPDALRCAVIVCSDSIAGGKNDDVSGHFIVEQLNKHGLENIFYTVVADDIDAIQSCIVQLKSVTDVAIFTGGTGLSKRDVTPEAISPMITQEIPGIAEAIRNYGQSRMPLAMLSRSITGMIDDMLVITLPGSLSGVKDAINAVFPHILHVFKIRNGGRHD